MEIYDLLKDTAEALVQDSDLEAWCVAVYGSALEVEIDEDIRDPSTAAPVLRLHSPYKRAHEEQRDVEHGFYMYVLVNTDADRLETQSNLSEYQATEQLMTFLGMVIEIVFNNKPAAAVMAYHLETDTITSFPYFEADVALEFTQHLAIGQNPITI